MGTETSSLIQYLSQLRHALNVLENVECCTGEDHRQFPVYDAWLDLVAVFMAISVAVKRVGVLVRRQGLSAGARPHEKHLSAASLEQAANRVWVEELVASQRSCVLVSEDDPEPLVIDNATQGKFVVVFDPLTGRAQPPCGEMGAIFGIFRQLGQSDTQGDEFNPRDVLQPARQLVGAGYALYGPAVLLYVSLGAGVQAFTLDGAMNEWIRTSPQVRIPICGHWYSLDEGSESLWDADLRSALHRYKESVSLNGERRSLRRTGSMVADLHRVMLYGGVLLYPPCTAQPQGHLKLLYEAGPLAFLVEQAGGRATDGRLALFDRRPTTLHERVPAYMGSVNDVELLEQLLAKIDRDPMFLLRRSVSVDEWGARSRLSDDVQATQAPWSPLQTVGGVLASVPPFLLEDSD